MDSSASRIYSICMIVNFHHKFTVTVKEIENVILNFYSKDSEFVKSMHIV